MVLSYPLPRGRRRPDQRPDPCARRWVYDRRPGVCNAGCQGDVRLVAQLCVVEGHRSNPTEMVGWVGGSVSTHGSGWHAGLLEDSCRFGAGWKVNKCYSLLLSDESWQRNTATRACCAGQHPFNAHSPWDTSGSTPLFVIQSKIIDVFCGFVWHRLLQCLFPVAGTAAIPPTDQSSTI